MDRDSTSDDASGFLPDSDVVPETPYTSGGPDGIAEDGKAADEADQEQREKHDDD